MTRIIREKKKENLIPYLKELFNHRRLIFSFAKREIKIQYSQTFIGILWSVITPLTGLIIFSVFFGNIIKVDTSGVPYPVFVLAGLSGWYYFTYLINNSGTSIINSQAIIRRIYFPKLVLPLSKVLVGMVNLCVMLLLLGILMIFTGHYPGINIVWLPLFILFNIITGLSIGIWISALSIRYRDFQMIIPYIIGFGIWMTPIFYPFGLIPENYQIYMYFNPMSAVAEGYRWTLLNGTYPDIKFLFSTIPVLVLFFTGLYYFIRKESKIVDII